MFDRMGEGRTAIGLSSRASFVPSRLLKNPVGIWPGGSCGLGGWMKRFVAVACLVVGLLGGVGFQAHSVAWAADGNSDAAHACQQGGYLTLSEPDGTPFANTGQCVSYFAGAGTACIVTSTTGCLTFVNTKLPSYIGTGNSITLT